MEMFNVILDDYNGDQVDLLRPRAWSLNIARNLKVGSLNSSYGFIRLQKNNGDVRIEVCRDRKGFLSTDTQFGCGNSSRTRAVQFEG